MWDRRRCIAGYENTIRCMNKSSHLKRIHEVVVRARIQPSNALVGHATRSKQEHGAVITPPQALEYPNPVRSLQV